MARHMEQNLKIRQEVLTLKCNCNSLKMHVALWDKFAFFVTLMSAATLKACYYYANELSINGSCKASKPFFRVHGNGPTIYGWVKSLTDRVGKFIP